MCCWEAVSYTHLDVYKRQIQTRIRTVLLMAVQNKADYILLNSSNKSENALGLCTLYGDTAGAFSPTGDLYTVSYTHLDVYKRQRRCPLRSWTRRRRCVTCAGRRSPPGRFPKG